MGLLNKPAEKFCHFWPRQKAEKERQIDISEWRSSPQKHHWETQKKTDEKEITFKKFSLRFLFVAVRRNSNLVLFYKWPAVNNHYSNSFGSNHSFSMRDWKVMFCLFWWCSCRRNEKFSFFQELGRDWLSLSMFNSTNTYQNSTIQLGFDFCCTLMTPSRWSPPWVRLRPLGRTPTLAWKPIR